MTSEKYNNDLCGCLVNVTTDQLRGFLSYPGVDLLEWRLDDFLWRHSPSETLDAMALLAVSPRHPFIVTNRPEREGGMYQGPEALRLDMLMKAVEAGAEWVDLELDTPSEALERFRSKNVQILISHHDFRGTPDGCTLREQVKKMARKGAKTVKLVTHARSSEDNLRVLELIPFARQELGVDAIAFCMGPLGRWSRLVSLMLGSPWTYVQLPGTSPAAPGQLTLGDMERLLNVFSLEAPWRRDEALGTE